MRDFVKNRVFKFIVLAPLVIFLPFIPIVILMRKAYKKLSGFIRIIALGILCLLLISSLFWSWSIVSTVKSPSSSVKQQVVNQENNPSLSDSIQLSPTVGVDVRVTKVIDGDTIQVVIDSKKETIRLIGIDSPETVDPRKQVQCFGKEASVKAKSLLSDQSVKLESDSTQGERDKYQRLLRYVFLEDGTNFNKLMISEGYAHEYTYNMPYKYQSDFKQAQKEAEENKRGLWADNACPTNTPQPSIQTSGTDDPTTAGGFTCGGKTTCGQMSSCAEAEFYLNTCGVSRLDGDKDGVPCESLCR